MNKAFGRLQVYLSALSALMQSGVGRVAAFEQIGHYKSRGKGKGLRSRVYRSTNKFKPHEGAKQQARRKYFTVVGPNGHATMQQFPKGHILADGIGGA